MIGSSGSDALLLLEGKFEGKKATEPGELEGHGLMTRCNGHRRTSIIKLKDWQRTAKHGDMRHTNRINRRLPSSDSDSDSIKY